MNPIEGIETKDSKSFVDVLADQVTKDTNKEKSTLFGGILGPKFDELMRKVNNVFATLTGKEIVPDPTEIEEHISDTRTSQSPESHPDSRLGDLTTLRNQYPKEAWSKCNNPAGITWNENFVNPKRGTLAYDLQQAGIFFYEAPGGRGPGEDGSYVGFNTMDDGLKAMVLLWEKSAKQGKTIAKRLSNYAGSPYKIEGVDPNMKFSELTSQQKNELLMKQIKQESSGLYAELNDRNIDFQVLNLV